MKIYQQTTEFTCGPSSSMMILEHFGLITDFSRELEAEISSKTVFSKKSGHSALPLLAKDLLERGLKAELHHMKYEDIQNMHKYGTAPYWKTYKRIKKYSKAELSARDIGLEVIELNPRLEDLVEDLNKGRKIMARINVGAGHIVVVNHYDGENFEIYCPSRGIYQIKGSDLLKTMHFPTGKTYLGIWQ